MSKRISDEELLCTILQSGSYTKAAQTLGISKQTVSRRLRDSELKNRITELRKGVLDSVNSRLLEASSMAIDVLISLLSSENEQSRYNSASRILTLTQSFIENEGIIRELEQLKIEMEKRKGEV